MLVGALVLAVMFARFVWRRGAWWRVTGATLVGLGLWVCDGGSAPEPLEARELQPMRMALAGHQLRRTSAHTLGAFAPRIGAAI